MIKETSNLRVLLIVYFINDIVYFAVIICIFLVMIMIAESILGLLMANLFKVLV